MDEPRKGPRDRGNQSPIAVKRMEKNLTQQQLADLIGKTRVDVSRWEAGKHTPSSIVLSKIAAALGCTMEEII